MTMTLFTPALLVSTIFLFASVSHSIFVTPTCPPRFTNTFFELDRSPTKGATCVRNSDHCTTKFPKTYNIGSVSRTCLDEHGCRVGYEWSNAAKCEDINECTGDHGCQDGSACFNVPGTYYCVCPGFEDGVVYNAKKGICFEPAPPAPPGGRTLDTATDITPLVRFPHGGSVSVPYKAGTDVSGLQTAAVRSELQSSCSMTAGLSWRFTASGDFAPAVSAFAHGPCSDDWSCAMRLTVLRVDIQTGGLVCIYQGSESGGPSMSTMMPSDATYIFHVDHEYEDATLRDDWRFELHVSYEGNEE